MYNDNLNSSYIDRLPVGLNYHAVEEENNDHCFYEAVALALTDAYDFQRIRNLVADELENKSEAYLPYMDDAYEAYNSPDELIDDVRLNKWADHMEVHACAGALQRRIYIISDDVVWPIGEDLFPESEPVFLGFRENHYDGILKMSGSSTTQIINFLKNREHGWTFMGGNDRVPTPSSYSTPVHGF